MAPPILRPEDTWTYRSATKEQKAEHYFRNILQELLWHQAKGEDAALIQFLTQELLELYHKKGLTE